MGLDLGRSGGECLQFTARLRVTGLKFANAFAGTIVAGLPGCFLGCQRGDAAMTFLGLAHQPIMFALCRRGGRAGFVELAAQCLGVGAECIEITDGGTAGARIVQAGIDVGDVGLNAGQGFPQILMARDACREFAGQAGMGAPRVCCGIVGGLEGSACRPGGITGVVGGLARGAMFGIDFLEVGLGRRDPSAQFGQAIALAQAG